MCGLVSMIARRQSGFMHKDVEIFEQMLILDTVRGKDSTGSFSKFGNGDVRVIKHGSHPFNLFTTNEWKDYRGAVIQRGKFIVGHNRAATRGSVNTDNAHPFVEDHIILVHNGTLLEQANLTDKKTDVDSHAIAHALAAEEDPGKVLKEINGAFALIWYNTKTDKLYCARNAERPLMIVTFDEFYVICSETWIGSIPMGRGGYEGKEAKIVKPGELVEFGALGVHESRPFELYKPKWQGNFPRQGHHYYGSWQEDVEDVPFDDGLPPLEIREALTAQPKKMTEQASKDCVLTQPKDGEKPAFDVGKEEKKLEANHSSIRVYNPRFQKNDMLVIKVHQSFIMNNLMVKFQGKCITPDKEMVDVSGFLPEDACGSNPQNQTAYFNIPLVGKVQYCTYTQGNWTVHVHEVRKATLAETHKTLIPYIYWDYAMNHCKCDQCDRKVEPWEIKFTSVKTKHQLNQTKSGNPLTTVTMKCPDCILQMIKTTEYGKQFEKDYNFCKEAIKKARSDASSNTSVPNWQQQRPESQRSDGGAIIVPPSPHLH